MIFKYKRRWHLLTRLLLKEVPTCFIDTQSIFIHIPKTAGISISSALYGRATGHMPIKIYKHILGNQFNDYFKFTFVRNPYERLISAYEFLKKGGMEKFPDDYKFKIKVIDKYPTFEKFVSEWLNEKNIFEFLHFIPQTYFITDNDKVLVDFVGKIENIDTDFSFISKKLKIQKDLHKLNATNYRRIYNLSNELKDKIKQCYRKDFELLGY